MGYLISQGEGKGDEERKKGIWVYSDLARATGGLLGVCMGGRDVR